MTRRVVGPASLVALIVGAALVLSACGYGLAGRNVTLPAHIKVIAIPPLANRTPDTSLEPALTEALRRELSSRGRWKVVPDASGADVDAVVTGTISSLTQTNRAFNDAHQATRVEVAVVTGVEFKDLRDSSKLLWANPSLVSSDEYPITAGTAATDPSSFLRQHRDAYLRLATKFARTVVTSMLEGM